LFSKLSQLYLAVFVIIDNTAHATGSAPFAACIAV
jgi:hypothetical protein